MSKRRKMTIGVGALVLLAGLTVWYVLHNRDRDLEVPLGVEHAVTIAYSGPELAVKPYRFGVPVNVRIANVMEKDGVRIYDIRYILNTGGEFNIMDYLTTTDGSTAEELPPFMVKGAESLSQQMDQRIERIEESGIEIWHYYYETMAAVIAVWVGWLLLLIFWRRPKPDAEIEVVQEPLFQELMARFIEQIENKNIDDENKARMEMLVIQRCRDHLGLTNLDMDEVVRRIGKDEKTSRAFNKLQQWLHDPKYSVGVEEMVETLRPLTAQLEESRS